MKTCDPWAVYLARNPEKNTREERQLTPRQQRLYSLVREKGEVTFPQAATALNLEEEEVRRLFAVLRHLELLKAGRRDGDLFLTLF